MNEPNPFLAAILASPDDDAPRLIYADWLEERGDPRGDFIRVQCELARLPQHSEQRRALEDRVEDLLSEFKREWDNTVSEACSGDRVLTSYRRGFVEEIEIEAACFVANADRLLSLAPISAVSLQKPNSHLEAVAGLRCLAKVTTLRLLSWDETYEYDAGLNIGGSELRILLASHGLSNVSTLDISGHKIGDDGIRTIAACRYLTRLTALHLRWSHIGEAGAVAIAKAEHMARITTLDLSHNYNLGDAGARHLAAAPHLSGLTELRLRYSGIGPNGAVALAASANLSQLRTLDLRGNHVGVSGAQAIASSPHLARLSTLNLDGNEIGNTGALALAQTTRLPQLTTLSVAKNGIRSTGKEALRIRFENGVNFTVFDEDE